MTCDMKGVSDCLRRGCNNLHSAWCVVCIVYCGKCIVLCYLKFFVYGKSETVHLTHYMQCLLISLKS